jgi:hypothetical protein
MAKQQSNPFYVRLQVSEFSTTPKETCTQGNGSWTKRQAKESTNMSRERVTTGSGKMTCNMGTGWKSGKTVLDTKAITNRARNMDKVI